MRMRMGSSLARVDAGGITGCSQAPGAAPQSGVQFFPAGDPRSCLQGAGGGVSQGRWTGSPAGAGASVHPCSPPHLRLVPG